MKIKCAISIEFKFDIICENNKLVDFILLTVTVVTIQLVAADSVQTSLFVLLLIKFMLLVLHKVCVTFVKLIGIKCK